MIAEPGSVDSAARRESAPSAFRGAVFFIAGGLAAWCLLIAWREWFFGDDFLFLIAARTPPRWFDVWLPLGPRQWWSYRPLSIDVYFRLGLWAFGYSSFGFATISLLFHFAGGALLYRIARRLGLDERGALATALLGLSRLPSLTAGFWISAFQHVAAATLVLAAVALFLDYCAAGAERTRAASCAALALALLCNESAAMALGALAALAWYQPSTARGVRRFVAALRRLAPHIILVAVYLVFRLAVLGPTSMPDAYATQIGWNLLTNARDALLFVCNDSAAFAAGAATLVLVALAIASRLERERLLRIVGISAAWTAIALLPYLPLTYADPRFAINIEAPLSLGVGAALGILLAHARGRRQPVGEIALLVLLIAAVPVGSLRQRMRRPEGAPGRRFVEQVRVAPIPAGSTLVVLYGMPGLADEAAAFHFRFLIFWGRAFDVALGDRDLRVKMLGTDEALSEKLRKTHCEFFALAPDLTLTPASPAQIDAATRRAR